jgi:putative ABC transport system permease protein
MLKVVRLAVRNLTRYGRRTALTGALIVIGVAAVLLFVAVTGSFKTLMVGQITDSYLGHLQVHRRGYVASIDSLPLNLNMAPAMVAKVDEALKAMPEVEAWSPRVKFAAMFSNFVETTSIRVNGVDPVREAATEPLLAGRVRNGIREGPLLERREILVPALLAAGLKVKPGDTVVLVATNREGSVNGKTLVIRGTLESATGPGGRDGYIHIDDARELLRMATPEVSETAVRVRDLSQVDAVTARLEAAFANVQNQQGKPALEVHSWQQLSPFANIAKMIDLMTLFIKVVLVAIVLVSVMNVMVMAVYERVREIGTIAAIGTPPRRILALFLNEGLVLALGATIIGVLISIAAVYALNLAEITYSFGQQSAIVLVARLRAIDVVTVAAMVVAIGVLATLQPAWKASRMDPIQALRHV